MKEYFAVDLIVDKNDMFNIIDIHTFSDAISFSEKAGYTPRKSRISKFMNLAHEQAEKKKIVHLTEYTHTYKLPTGVLNFFKSLPKNSYNLNWVKIEIEKNKKFNPTLFKNEILYMEQAARRVGADYIPAHLKYYGDKLYVDEFSIKKMTEKTTSIPYEDIGLILFWGNDSSKHPGFWAYWDEEKKELPTLNSLKTFYFFNSASKLNSHVLVDEIVNVLPNTIFVGMANSTSEQLSEFIDKFDNFVYKPSCTHGGNDINFLSKEEAYKLMENEKKIEPIYDEIKQKISEFENNGFDIEKNKFNGFFRTDEGKGIFDLTSLGTYLLQERIIARPFKSTKTGKYHTGTIRAQIYAGEPIGVMHRFSTEEYNGTFQRITDREHRTFWERTDDSLEKRIVDFLVPIFTKIENELN
jgi:hypothetical protein